MPFILEKYFRLSNCCFHSQEYYIAKPLPCVNISLYNTKIHRFVKTSLVHNIIYLVGCIIIIVLWFFSFLANSFKSRNVYFTWKRCNSKGHMKVSMWIPLYPTGTNYFLLCLLPFFWSEYVSFWSVKSQRIHAVPVYVTAVKYFDCSFRAISKLKFSKTWNAGWQGFASVVYYLIYVEN